MATNPTKIPVMRPKGVKSPAGGKPQRFAVEEVERALIDTAGIVSLAANKLQCHRLTVNEYMDKYPHLRLIRAQGKTDVVDIAEGHFIAAVRSGKQWAVERALRTAGKDRGYGDTLEITGDGDAPVHVRSRVTVRHIKSIEAEDHDSETEGEPDA